MPQTILGVAAAPARWVPGCRATVSGWCVPGPLTGAATTHTRTRPGQVRGREVSYLNKPTAREITSAITTSDSADCASMAIFAHRANGIVSVGLNEQAFVNDTYR